MPLWGVCAFDKSKHHAAKRFLFQFLDLQKEGVMNNIEEIMPTICIGLVVASFLLNTGRAVKPIELCKENLVLLDNIVPGIEEQIIQEIYRAIYEIMFMGYCRISDETNVISCGRKLLVIYRECGERVYEGKLGTKLAKIYLSQSKYFEAKEMYERTIIIMREIGDRAGEATCYGDLGTLFKSLGRYVRAKEFLEKALAISLEISDREVEAICYNKLGNVFQSLGEYVKAKEYLHKALAITKEIGDRAGEASSYGNLGTVFQCLGQYVKAKEYYEKALAMQMRIGDRAGEASSYGNLGTVFQSLSQYVKAEEYYEKALAMLMEIGDIKGEATIYGNLGSLFKALGEYVKAKEYLERALAITMEIGDKAGEASCYGILGSVFQSLGQCIKAKEYFEKALAIKMEIGDRAGEASCNGNLGVVFQSLGQCVKAKEYLEKALAITMENGCRAQEASWYANLGTVFKALGEYVKAKEYLEKALAIEMEIGDRAGEASCYGNLGSVFQSLGECVKAKEYYEKALAITMEIGYRAGKASCYANLGTVFAALGENVKAKEYLEKALAIKVEIGDSAGEASCYENLGTVSQSLGQCVKARKYYEKALAIRLEIGDKKGEATNYDSIGMVFQSLGQYVKAKQYHEKAFAIARKLGDKEGEAKNYCSIGHLFHTLGEYVKAKEYFEKELNIRMEIGDREGEAEVYVCLGAVSGSVRNYRKSKEYCDKALLIFSETGRKGEEANVYGNLGVLLQFLGDNFKAKEYYEKSLAITLQNGDRKQEAINYYLIGSVFQKLDEHVMAEEYFEKALTLLKDFRYTEIDIQCYLGLTCTKLSQEEFQEAFSYLSQSIKKCEDIRGVNADSDHVKVSLADKHSVPYKLLSTLFCATGDLKNALIVEELGRARALADLMATQYSAEKHKSADPQSWTAIENVMKKESNCQCLYISYDTQELYLWLLEKSGAIHFRNIRLEKKTLRTRLAKVARNLDEFFAIMAESFRSFGILPEQICEDRSLKDFEPTLESCPEESLEPFRGGKDKDDPKLSLTLFYEMLINPVCELLDEPEIIIVPDRGLYRVPFPALLDESGKYLTEKFIIRIVPSLTTLKFIQESPADYHSQTGALIVGDPDVGEVIYRGSVNKKFVALPGARKEAEMIGELLGVEPLLGQHATKPVVLARISSVSLIHIAAHGNAERGEIALAPAGVTTEIPQEDDYLLKMSDISQVQVRAKLVVLSCCHSGRGQIRAEGVVGIARAFLGSGARSVLVALWALEDSATEQLMSRFYEHLFRGVSVSECLHEAMKWMRENGFSEVHEWAPFMLVGDNTSFAFGKNE